MKSIKLSSGNTYYFDDSNSNFVTYGFIVNPDDTFKGGFLAKEAIRKYATFSKLSGVEITSDVTYDLKKLKLQEFAEKLGSASASFINNFHKEVNDLDDADGTCSRAQSCDDRQRYYVTVGLDCAFKSHSKFTIGFFIANHLAIFGVNNFRTTFFRGNDNPQKDDELERSEIFMKNVYSDCGFKAPAAYVKALVG